MITVIINGDKLDVPKNTTVLQACNLLNINIPKFCFHENLQIAGNCRMCLVEVENSPKPVVSCSMPVMPNMKIFTNSPLVKKSRESVLEFLLINHPLDCPICDQGGECDLQDQTLTYGTDRRRFFFNKRSVEDKNCSPFIKTIMTRCIHCTKCVRFAQEVCSVDGLGTTGRGNNTEISFYLSKMFNSEFSANVIDLCPVGALISKPYTFKARPWELKEYVTVDPFNLLGTEITVQTINNNIIRVLPITNKLLNIEWINNKTRFFFDSINYQRIEEPLLKKNGKFEKISWELAFKILKVKLKIADCSKKNAVIGNFIGVEELYKFKNLTNILGIKQSNYISNQNGLKLNSDIPNYFLYTQFINKLKNSNLCLLINYNPRIDCSLLNLKLKNLKSKNNLDIYSVGPSVNLTYDVKNIGLTSNSIISIIEGKHKLCKKILKSKNFTIILGSNLYNNKNISLLSYFITKFKSNLNTLTIEPGFINYLEVIGSQSKEKRIISNLLLLYNTNLTTKQVKNYNTKNSFSVYFGHHFNNNALNCNLLLPTLTFLEKKTNYLSVVGCVQQANKIKINKTQSKNDLILFKNLVQYLKVTNIERDIKFTKLFSYFSIKQIQTIFKGPKIFINQKGTKINLNIFKVLNDKFFPKNIFEKNSKTLMNSLTFFKKTSNFNL
jgi:NADH-quinone oxidoreductase chain G